MFASDIASKKGQNRLQCLTDHATAAAHLPSLADATESRDEKPAELSENLQGLGATSCQSKCAIISAERITTGMLQAVSLLLHASPLCQHASRKRKLAELLKRPT